MLLHSSPPPRYSRPTVFFSFLGAVLIVFGITLHIRGEIEKQGMQETTGILISFFQKDRGEGFKKTDKCPRVRFYTLTQIPVTVEGRQCTSYSKYEVNDQVKVFYPPEHPEQALLVVDADEWFYVVLSCGFGAMMWVFALCTHTPRDRTGFNKSLMDKWGLTLSFWGIALVLYGLSFWVLQLELARQAPMTETTTGIVINPGYANTGRNSKFLCALIEFQTPNHESYQFSTSVCSNGYDRGETVSVRYAPANPRHAMLDSFWDSMFIPVILFLIGFPFLVVGMVSWPRRLSRSITRR
ncbi:DUF3592 domain-containing protein [Pseudomonas mucidolens]|uniref:DUF3592 domain-containing protein n=1 Tax=Pseudomonas mucidolens TaxID=46679 RepID=A0A1H2NPD3_9PSED|nr:DUF3592 domain-containing protein [Pseudomonas mucidolens]SDV07260.1 Protein of unknown function [Pseudomonas mucidolens]SQH31399.1 Protein of uncharacterised function (DUF3592) [Pseudomonas mucidolens]